MTIPQQLLSLIERLNRELTQTQQEAMEGLNLVRQLLLRYPDNIALSFLLISTRFYFLW